MRSPDSPVVCGSRLGKEGVTPPAAHALPGRQITSRPETPNVVLVNETNSIKSASLDHAWVNCVNEWHNPRNHDELLRLVMTHEAYAWAARRYREYMEKNPCDAVAQKNLKRIQTGMWVKYAGAAQHEKKAPMPYRKTISILTMLCVALGFGTMYTACLPGAPAGSFEGKQIDGVVTMSKDVAPIDQDALAFEDIGERSIEGLAAK